MFAHSARSVTSLSGYPALSKVISCAVKAMLRALGAEVKVRHSLDQEAPLVGTSYIQSLFLQRCVVTRLTNLDGFDHYSGAHDALDHLFDAISFSLMAKDIVRPMANIRLRGTRTDASLNCDISSRL